LTKADLIRPEFCLYSGSACEIYYVPFDYHKPQARLFIAGITPGWTQMELAYRTLDSALAQGQGWSAIYTAVEQTASFAGAMRTNLVTMLDALDLPRYLNLSSSDGLFSTNHHLVNTTSVIRYAVFVRGENYRGDRPKILKHTKLREYAETEFAEELRRVPNALVIPQGKAVRAVLEHLIAIGQLPPERCLLDFPHASGANGHRHRFFATAKATMRQQVAQWFG
jgi:hypothetical protein